MAEASTRLSTRQTEIARLISSGKSNREIALELFISERTVEAHVTAIYTKLDVRSRTELTIAMLRAVDDERPAWTSPTNVPLSSKPLVGREEECARIHDALEACALVTITGPGGIGKTRTALEIGRERGARMREETSFIDLTPIGDPSAVAATIAHALGLPESRDSTSLTRLVTFLHAKRLLLILDNCEHVIGEVARVVDGILAACPHVRILATSREALQVGGERVCRLPPLRSPDAIVLFVARAVARDDRFVLDDEMRSFVSDICVRLDGIPLAIELAAARVGMFSVREIASTLDRRLSLLSNGERSALPRHKTIRALLDWSYELLDAPEQRLFTHLAIFAGGCSLSAVGAVCPELDPAEDNVRLLSSLVDKSLVVATSESRESRYRMLESSRLYAREKLASRSWAHEAARLHALFYTELAEAHELAYASEAEPAWRERAESELENWRAALRFSFGDDGDVAIGQRLAGALGPVWRHFAYAEGREWIDRASERERATTDSVAARVSLARAAIALGFAEYETALRSAQTALAIYRHLGEPVRAAHANYIVGHSRILQGNIGSSVTAVREALDVARSHHDVRLTGLALESLAIARLVAEDLTAARTFFRDALAVFAALRAERNVTLVSVNLAETEFQAGEVQTALELAQTALPHARKLDPHFAVATLGNIAAYLVALDRYDEARSRAIEAFELAQGLQLDVFVAWTLQRLAAIAALHYERFDSAARLVGYIDARVSKLDAVRHHTERQEYDRIVIALHGAIDADTLVALQTSGASMNDESAVAEALAATR